jgi:DNA-binding SARP family transcriptional activator
MTATASPATGRALPRDRVMTLRLMGGFHLRVDREELTLSPSAERLVALLALEGRLTRSCAAGTLWPEIPEGRALPRLRTCIWRVNEQAPRVVLATRSTVLLDPRIVVDVHTGAVVAPAGDAERALTSEGDLLPSWDDEWLIVERERLRQIRLHQLDAEAIRLLGDRQFGLALAAAYAALGADPFRESALQTIIAVHLAEGNRAEAARIQVLLQQLREEATPVRASPAEVPEPRRSR